MTGNRIPAVKSAILDVLSFALQLHLVSAMHLIAIN